MGDYLHSLPAKKSSTLWATRMRSCATSQPQPSCSCPSSCEAGLGWGRALGRKAQHACLRREGDAGADVRERRGADGPKRETRTMSEGCTRL